MAAAREGLPQRSTRACVLGLRCRIAACCSASRRLSRCCRWPRSPTSPTCSTRSGSAISLLGKPRMESVALLAGVAARTKRVRIGPACMASFPLRDPVLLAYQWASLDLLAEGRTVLVACTGIVPQEGGRIEGQLYGLERRDRVAAHDRVDHAAQAAMDRGQRQLRGPALSLRGDHASSRSRPPSPARRSGSPTTHPLATRSAIRRTLRRVVNHADGWETSLFDPADVGWRIQDSAGSRKRPDATPTPSRRTCTTTSTSTRTARPRWRNPSDSWTPTTRWTTRRRSWRVG